MEKADFKGPFTIEGLIGTEGAEALKKVEEEADKFFTALEEKAKARKEALAKEKSLLETLLLGESAEVIEDLLKTEEEILQEATDKALKIFGDGEEEKADIIESSHEKIRAIEQETFNIREQISLQTVGLLESQFAAAALLAEEGSALQTSLIIFEKIAAIARIIIASNVEIAAAALQITATIPFPANIPLIAARTAAIKTRSGLSIAAIATAAIPQLILHEGGEITGRVRHGDVPIMAQEGEFMMKTKAVEHYGLQAMESINNMEIKPMVGFTDANIVEEIRILNKNFAARPVNHMIWNEKGFSHYMVKGENRIKYLERRYV